MLTILTNAGAIVESAELAHRTIAQNNIVPDPGWLTDGHGGPDHGSRADDDILAKNGAGVHDGAGLHHRGGVNGRGPVQDAPAVVPRDELPRSNRRIGGSSGGAAEEPREASGVARWCGEPEHRRRRHGSRGSAQSGRHV